MNRKETIKHFIKWYCYAVLHRACNEDYDEVLALMLSTLDNYIENEHYNFSPFEEINN